MHLPLNVGQEIYELTIYKMVFNPINGYGKQLMAMGSIHVRMKI